MVSSFYFLTQVIYNKPKNVDLDSILGNLYEVEIYTGLYSFYS